MDYPPGGFNINKEVAGDYYLGEFDQALFQYLSVGVEDHRQNSGMRPHTLNIFPSQPMHVIKGNAGLVCAGAASGSNISSESSMGFSHPTYEPAFSAPPEPAKVVYKHDENYRKGPTSSEQEPKTADPKNLRRLAQNREAARKSRLRKKAYVQQLETSKMKLLQLEHEIQRAKAQGLYLEGTALMGNNVPGPDAVLFDMEYIRWLEDHKRQAEQLRLAHAQADHLPENELCIFVDNHLAHYDKLFKLKSDLVKSDIFHIFSGMWKTPAECCLLWMGGCRPSELVKMILSQIVALGDQQLVELYGLQRSIQEAEEALTQGYEALNQSITEAIASDSLTIEPNMTTYSAQMTVAINKLSTLKGFITQADSLRQQTLRRLRRILSTRQSAQCFLAIDEYFQRLRTLSSLWLGRSHPE
ncbi:hypothetical protein ACS0TY_031676 [Phlomoides rotata]